MVYIIILVGECFILILWYYRMIICINNYIGCLHFFLRSQKISRLPPSNLRHIAKRTKRYMSRSTEKRERDINVRCPECDPDANGGGCSVSSFLLIAHRTSTAAFRRGRAIYREQGPFNRYVEVRSGCNIATN